MHDQVIKRAKGLAIFTVFRTGLHWSGAGGSGIVVARTTNGSWSPPSGILIHTLGWGLIAGADIYDCVCVINNDQGMEGFTRVRCTLGGEVSAAVGPLGGGSNLSPSSSIQHRFGRTLRVGVYMLAFKSMGPSSRNEPVRTNASMASQV